MSNFPEAPLLVRSPGRINILGEHVDYNNGIVLPAAIDKSIWIAVGKSAGRESRILAADLDEDFSFPVDSFGRSDKSWPNYILGVIDQLQKNSFPIGNINAVFGGDIPLGAGLSSSAAIECGFLFALKELFSLDISLQKMAELGQQAEHTFVGTKCGIMDQFANLFGKEDHIIELDCRSLDHRHHRIDLGSNELVLLDTGVKHSLAESEYNTRRKQCEEGVQILQKEFNYVKSLRDADLPGLEKLKSKFPEEVYNRCYYVLSEMKRVGQAIIHIENGKTEALGELMFETHQGLSEFYSVSCAELDFLVQEGRQIGAIGARMMGGGFGGCTLNLINRLKIKEFVEGMTKRYWDKFQLPLKAIPVKIENGTSLSFE